MCTLGVKEAANDRFEDLKPSKQDELWDLANEDSPDIVNGLGQQIYDVPEWHDLAQLHAVRKGHLGRHRMYVTGRNTGCHYCIVYIWPFKRKEEDKPGTSGYQGVILKALAGRETRVTRSVPLPPKPQLPEPVLISNRKRRKEERKRLRGN